MTQRGPEWFWHILALALGGTVGELQRRMSQAEFENWVAFYRAFPFDDLHRHHRPAALIARSMAGGAIDDLLDWLQPPARSGEYDAAALRTMAALGVHR